MDGWRRLELSGRFWYDIVSGQVYSETEKVRGRIEEVEY